MDLEDRLASLGDHLAIGDGSEGPGLGLSERVLAQLDASPIPTAKGGRNRHAASVLRYAAVVFALAAVIAVAVPSSRQAIARWFGLDGVRIERQDLDVPTTPGGSAPASAGGHGGGVTGLPGPGESREVTVDDQVVLVSVFEGSLTAEVLVKTLGPATEIVDVVVGDSPGLWISGEPHELAYLSPDGSIVFERIAGNTLVWQDGLVIGRLEGFDSLDAAVEYAVKMVETGTID